MALKNMAATRVSRRKFIASVSLLPLCAFQVPLCSGCEDDSTNGTLPRSPFGEHSTAEEVTQGLDLTGKVALITGCNAGIGYETLRVLVMRGAHVFGLARNREKAEQACSSVSQGNAKGRATPFVCEQTDFSSVAACADAIQALGKPIDILICNAGVNNVEKLELVHGVYKQFAVNHLSHFILVNRLLQLVKAASQGRIVTLGSKAYQSAADVGIEFDNLAGQRHYDMNRMYAESKLANGLFARELAHRLCETAATSNVVSPGVVDTDMFRKSIEMFHVSEMDLKKHQVHVKTPQQGAATSCYAATNPALEKVSGCYFEDCNIVVPGGHMRDDALARKLWAVSEELTRPYL